MSNADLIQFDAYINKDNKIVAYIMPLITNTANVKFKKEAVSNITNDISLTGYINQKVDNEVEL
jgi:hypothetical protein